MNQTKFSSYRQTPENEARKRQIIKVTGVGLFVNILLSCIKFAAGVIGSSQAVIADAVKHNLLKKGPDVVDVLIHIEPFRAQIQ